VLDLVLDEPDFLFGYYNVFLPAGLPIAEREKKYREQLMLLKQNGSNTFSGGPNILFKGLSPESKPVLDFSECDAFFRIARECGFTREIQSYAGPAMVTGLHDGYIIGPVARKWEQQTGKPFSEILSLVWNAVKEHSEREKWLPVAYNFFDEPRVIENIKSHLETIATYRNAVPFLRIGGPFSVDWTGDHPFNKSVQELFNSVDWVCLNVHSQVDLDKAKEFKKDLLIYNQSIDRFGFGAYHWAAFKKGIKGRYQISVLELSGYQFFDLDGWWPDTHCINYCHNEILPTVALQTCREGMDDFKFAVTLWNLAEKKLDQAEAQQAQAWLKEIAGEIVVGQRISPKDFIAPEAFRNTCVGHILKLHGKK
jgi:hypothetical protein